MLIKHDFLPAPPLKKVLKRKRITTPEFEPATSVLLDKRSTNGTIETQVPSQQ